MKKSLIALALILIATSFSAYADSFKTVSIGVDLSQSQREQMLDFFGVSQDEAMIVTVTNDEEREYLSGIASESAIGQKAISCSYVEPLGEGSGLDVSVSNLTWVSEEMIANSLATAGVKDAKVVAGAPFKVSGTAALTGVMKGFEKATGKKLDVEAKDAANREMITTGELAQEIGKDQAVKLMNDIKQEVLENKIKDTDDIRTIIEKIAQHNGVKLSEDQINQIIDVMQRISKLDIDIKEISKQLKGISDKLSKIIEQNEEAKSFLEEILENIKLMVLKLKFW
ncbi:Uncharacterized protein YpuA, DUF1002 family [Peptoclostridium litorale DSM 5388]|uniref:DUF1002 domain-containing protein n=1 Tax=Peptoclostridium litorale DSM 5388 TaxID=1121324 RepID=A0A069RI60_PEPLI|nr:DUF1002 domain-containing protein [Peptoclostridium litorale]KDR96719.1 hypothetical protein CLIT_2c03250 [Peptoclostridium litorale DSM 5388]SIN67447.1 Uncharacterized protein YpuA, DUF1002 family [Peptoclostridium litorale DSM 5388]